MTKKNNYYALIIVDMQNDFVLPDSPAAVNGAIATIPKIQEILKFFRDKKWPVFHVTREHRGDGSDIEITRLERFCKGEKIAVSGTKGCRIVNALKPIEGEYHIIKKRFSAFMNTELDFMLRRIGVDSIIVCGTQYPNCIRATIYDGVAYGYNVIVLVDATSAENLTIAKANINDISNIGVPCISVKECIETIR
jgi:nicotinamidase-related amidase